MKELIEDLLTFSQTTASTESFEVVDMNTILEEVKSILSASIEEKNAIIESLTTLPILKGIRFQIQQLLLNLLSNSIKYCIENARPHIKISCEKLMGKENDNIGMIPGKYYYKLKFEDNGIGFEVDDIEKIFGLFQRLHNKDQYSGTGIGLAICRKIVQNHEGFITAKSSPGKGSVFCVFLPADPISKSGEFIN
jgi:signal transduction histidine kinase